jgi:hypothetical protein
MCAHDGGSHAEREKERDHGWGINFCNTAPRSGLVLQAKPSPFYKQVIFPDEARPLARGQLGGW